MGHPHPPSHHRLLPCTQPCPCQHCSPGWARPPQRGPPTHPVDEDIFGEHSLGVLDTAEAIHHLLDLKAARQLQQTSAWHSTISPRPPGTGMGAGENAGRAEPAAGTEDLTSRCCQLQVIGAILVCVEGPGETAWVSHSWRERGAAPLHLPILLTLRSGQVLGTSQVSPSCHTATPTPCPSPLREARLPGRAGRTAGRAYSPPCQLAAVGQGPKVGDREVTWAQGPAGRCHPQTAGCRAVPQATVALQLLACPSLCRPPQPHQLPTSFGDSPAPQQGTQGCSRAWLREPLARQAPGRGRTPEHQQQQINVPPGCDGAVMETVPWKPFPADGKPPLAPAVPQPPPPELHRDPPPARTSPGACSQLCGGGRCMLNWSRAGGRGDGCC